MKNVVPSILAAFFLYQNVNADSSDECTPLTTVTDFDLKEFVKARWYVHQQAPTKYVPIERNFCSTADYTIIDGKPTFPWGYTVKVNNHAEDKDGTSYGGELCAYQDDGAKLGVAPCALPKPLSGPYWIVAYDPSDEGYALISGGQPSIKSKDTGLCRTGDGVLESGLWIFLRTRERNDDTIAKVRDIAMNMGLDLSVLNNVDQTNCKERISEVVSVE